MGLSNKLGGRDLGRCERCPPGETTTAVEGDALRQFDGVCKSIRCDERQHVNENHQCAPCPDDDADGGWWGGEVGGGNAAGGPTDCKRIDCSGWWSQCSGEEGPEVVDEWTGELTGAGTTAAYCKKTFNLSSTVDRPSDHGCEPVEDVDCFEDEVHGVVGTRYQQEATAHVTCRAQPYVPVACEGTQLSHRPGRVYSCDHITATSGHLDRKCITGPDMRETPCVCTNFIDAWGHLCAENSSTGGCTFQVYGDVKNKLRGGNPDGNGGPYPQNTRGMLYNDDNRNPLGDTYDPAKNCSPDGCHYAMCIGPPGEAAPFEPSGEPWESPNENYIY